MDAPQLRILHNIIVSPKQMYSMDNVVLWSLLCRIDHTETLHR